jgi:general secretion pathway protein F
VSVPVFEYVALDASGERVRGRMEALSPQAVVTHLQAHGHLPIEARELAIDAVASDVQSPALSWRRPVGSREIAGFFRALSALLAAGHAVDQALGVLEGAASSKRLGRAIGTIRAKVRAGQTLSSGLEEAAPVFTPLDVSIVRAGEATGVLPLVLRRLADYRDNAARLRESVTAALYYPAIVVGVAAIAIVLLLSYVVPQFEQLFAEAHAALPRPTRFVIATGRFLRDDGWALLLGLAGLLLLYERAMRRPGPRLLRDRLLLRVPILRGIILDTATARLSETLATLLESGLELPAALALARGVVGNRALALEIERAILGVREGRLFSDELRAGGHFSRLAVSMLRVGEETGSLAQASAQVALFFTQRLERSLKRLLVLVEPALILTVGLLVGGIVFSIIIAVVEVNGLAG